MEKKFLNLDTLTSEKKEIQLNGKKYELKPVSVAKLLNYIKGIDGLDEQAQIEQSLKFFNNLSPEAAKDNVFDELNMKQMFALINFVSSSVEEETETEVSDVKEEIAKKK